MSSRPPGEVCPRPSTFLTLPRRERAQRLFAILEERLPGIFDEDDERPYLPIVEKLLGLREHWIRDPEHWRPNPRRSTLGNFVQFLRFVIERYRPHENFFVSFRERRWRSTLDFEWYFHVVIGKNIRTAHGLPFPLTKAAAHLLNEAPYWMNIRQALRWAQFSAIGLDEEQIDAMLWHRCYDPRRAGCGDPFWEGVALKIAVEGIAPDTIATLLDYLRIRRRRDASFSMRKRSLAKLVDEAFELHCEAVQDRIDRHNARLARGWENQPKGQWSRAKTILPLSDVHPEFTSWQIFELLSAADLFLEGRRMGHCVATYKSYCLKGYSSIWAVREIQPNGSARNAATIDVNPATRRVVQVQGKFNNQPTATTMQVVRRWAKSNHLTGSVLRK